MKKLLLGFTLLISGSVFAQSTELERDVIRIGTSFSLKGVKILAIQKDTALLDSTKLPTSKAVRDFVTSRVAGVTGSVVTSISQGWGITNTPNPIVTTGTIKADSASFKNVFWARKGNSGINPATDFLGTIDSVNFPIRINNIERLLFKSDGKNITFTSANTTNINDSSSIYLNAASLTSGHGITIKAPLLSNGALINLQSVGTGALGAGGGNTSQRGMYINLSGTNATSLQSSYGVYIQNQHTGITAQNWGIYAESSGGFYNTTGQFVASNSGSYGTNAAVYATATGGQYNYSGVFDQGDFGIGTIAPTSKFHIISTTEQQRIGYNVFNYYKTTVGATGSVIFNAVGTDSSFIYNDAVTVNGNFTLGTVGNKVNIATGSNASAGTGTFTTGSASIGTAAVTNSSLIFIQYTNCNNCGTTYIGTVTAGVDFIVNSTNDSDASTFNWWIIN